MTESASYADVGHINTLGLIENYIAQVWPLYTNAFFPKVTLRWKLKYMSIHEEKKNHSSSTFSTFTAKFSDALQVSHPKLKSSVMNIPGC